MKKTLTIILAIALLAGMTASCGNGGNAAPTAEATTAAPATTTAAPATEAPAATEAATTAAAETAAPPETTAEAATTAATTAAPETEAATEPPQAPAPSAIDITLCLYFNDASDYPELKDDFPPAFEAKTGVKLNMTVLPREEYTSKLDLLALSGTLKGMIRTFGVSDVIRFKNDGIIDPMQTLEANSTWKSLPQDMQDNAKFDGVIWGIPMGYSRTMFARAYRKDWLDNLGLQAPSTIDEFYEVMRAFTFDDPNQSGAQDTFGFTSSSTWTMQDVFQAYDARLDNTGSCSIAYDPALGYFTDTMGKPEMVECLQFLNKCYSEGLLDPETFTNGGAAMRNRMWNGQAGSIFYWSHWPSQTIDQFYAIEPNAAIQMSYGLVGKRTQWTNFVSMPSQPPYVLAKGTPDGDLMCETFVNTFYGSPEGHEMARFGIEGVTYRKDGDMRIMLRDPATNTPYPYPGIVSEIPQYNIISLPYANDGTPDEIEASLQMMQNNARYVLDAMDDPQIYIVQYDIIISDSWDRLRTDIETAFNECISTAVTGEAGVEQAIATYINTMKAIGAADVINECNATYGLTSPAFAY